MKNNNNPVQICSHKRSGTHFLCATILKNFKLSNINLVSYIHTGRKFVVGDEEWKVGSRVEIPWGGLWRTHNYFNPKWFKYPEKVLYIVRNPIDTLLSHWRFIDPLRKKDHKIYLGENSVKTWYKHAKGYTNNCYWIKYEDLVGDAHDGILDDIKSNFNLESKFSYYQRVSEKVGWYSADDPLELDEPVEEIIRICRKVIPSNFLGYDL